MPYKSSVMHYGAVAITLHWLSALLIIALVVLGFSASGNEDTTAKIGLLRLHVVIGSVVLLLTLARVFWWLFADRKPTPPHMPAWQNRSSQVVHFLFYVVIIGMAASGMGLILISNAAPVLFESAGSTLPDFHNFKPRTPHGIGARILVVLFVLHVGAALYHHIIQKDGLLKRMWFSK